MTIATRQSAFIYGATESISEIVFPVILSAARYTVLAYDLATSDEARQTYRWVSQMTVALGQLAFWSTVWAWAKVSAWAEVEVQSCLFVADEDYEIDFQQDYDVPDDIWNSDPDHFPGVGEMVEADPFSPTVNPAYATVPATIAAPVATLVVPVASPLESMTTAQLRKMAIAHNQGLAKDDPRRIHGAARLTKAQALAALG
jgi:hypothetical protein